MLKNRPFFASFLSSAALFVYIYAVGWMIINGEKMFGKNADIVSVLLFLFLFVFSALTCGLLVLGGPIYLYLEKEKKTAIKMLSCNIAFLALFLAAAAILKIFLKF